MLPTLDTTKRELYKPPPRTQLWRAGTALLVAVGLAGSAQAEVVSGVQLPDGAEKVGENRYRVRQDFDEALKYYRTVLPAGAFPRRSVVNQPGVKAVHISNPGKKRFEGINIYQANDEVRIFIIVAAPEPKKKAEAKPKKK
ncbi:MAG: hypothetical protein M3Y59_21330 [Myxococcota bacterium]|nr:hypothetical protein [Myxococcota bacterium]